MPKLKTKKGVAKRFRITKSGRVKHHASYRRHLLSGRAKDRKRRLKRDVGLSSPSDIALIRRQMPYG